MGSSELDEDDLMLDLDLSDDQRHRHGNYTSFIFFLQKQSSVLAHQVVFFLAFVTVCLTPAGCSGKITTCSLPGCPSSS